MVQTKTENEANIPQAQDRAPWEAPFAEVLDVAAGTNANPTVASDAGFGSSHS